MLFWRLAFRNLFRHKTRLALNLILLVGAFTAIVVFKGFKTYVLGTMRDVIVETQLGDLQVAKPQLWNNSPVDRATDRMIADPQGLKTKLSLDAIQYISPRISFYGLINTETKSLPTKFIGFDPALETKLQPRLSFIDGAQFTDVKQAIVSSGLQKNLKLKAGDEVTIVSPTLDGSLNAMDIKVTGVFQTGFSEMDNATVFLSLKDAQKVLDTDHADTLMIVLKDRDQADQVQAKAQGIVGPYDKPGGLEGGLQVKTWRELSGLYSQVETFFNFQNTVIEVILLVLLLLSVSNTMSMTVFERLSEIGTLRALGDYESDIRRLMLIEAILLGALATALAIPISYGVIALISSIAHPVVLPLASRPMPLQVVPYLGSYLEAMFVCFFSIVVASIWPAKKGAHTSIVEALRAKS